MAGVGGSGCGGGWGGPWSLRLLAYRRVDGSASRCLWAEPLGSVCSLDRAISYCVVLGRPLFLPLVSPVVKGERWLDLEVS